MGKITLYKIKILLMLILTPLVSLAADGDLDPTFGGTGIVTTPVGTQSRFIGTTVQADGKIIAVGRAVVGTQQFLVVRYNTNGTTDGAFGVAGVVTTPIGTTAEAFAPIVQPDGKIIVVGQATVGGVQQYTVARYLTTGALDPSFGGGTGIVNTTIGTASGAAAVALQPDGKIVVAGQATVGGIAQFVVARYLDTGALDPAFGGGTGFVTTDIGDVSAASAVAIQTDGKIVAVGQSILAGTNRFTSARYLTNGTLDATYGTGGIATTVIGTDSASFAMRIQADGRIVISGFADIAGTSEFAVARYLTNGTSDPSFNGTGFNTTPIGTFAFAFGIVIQSDGKAVVAGIVTVGGVNQFGLTRYNTNGTLDGTFGTAGIVTTDVGGNSAARTMALQTDGKILAVGYGTTAGAEQATVIRYLGSSTIEPTVITSPTNGSVTNDPTPTITGTAQSTSNITLFLDGVELGGTVTIGATDTWTFTPSVPLADGTYTLVATSEYPAGNVNLVSNTVTFTIDTVAPPVPVIITPANGSTINDSTPTISGTAAGDAVSVDIVVDGITVATNVPVVAGAWSYTLTAGQALADGPHQADVTARDAAGNVSAPATSNFTVDTVAPPVPVIITPANGSTINDSTPTISGTASGDAVSVDITVDGVTVATGVPVIAGAWSYTLSAGQALADGPHQADVVARDLGGNTSAPATSNFIVDTIAPPTPVIITPVDGSSINTATPTISGTASGDAVVVDIVVDGVTVATGVPVVAGNWSYTLSAGQALADGPHQADVVARDLGGNTSAPATSNFIVDTIAPPVPVIVTPADGSTVTTSTPTISGTASGDAVVVDIAIDGIPVATSVPVIAGAWSYTLSPAQALSEGAHQVAAAARDLAGNVSAPDISNFIVDTVVPAPVITAPANGSTVTTTTPTIAGTASGDATSVDIVIDGVVIATGVPVVNDVWSYTLSETQALGQGTHQVEAIARDAVGNASTPATTSFAIDTVVPTPVIRTPANGSVIQDNTPTISGTVLGDAVSVDIFVDGVLVASDVPVRFGNWTYTLTDLQGLSEGPHQIEVIARDALGNTSEPGQSSFAIQTIVPIPAPPVVTQPANGSLVGTNTPVISGLARDPNSVTVDIFIDGVFLARVPVVNGRWSYALTPAQALSEGVHTVVAVARNSAGDVSEPSNTIVFEVLTSRLSRLSAAIRAKYCSVRT